MARGMHTRALTAEQLKEIEILRAEFPEEPPSVVEDIYRASPNSAEIRVYRLTCREHRRRDPALIPGRTEPHFRQPAAPAAEHHADPVTPPSGTSWGHMASCDYCGQQFGASDAMWNHVNIVHAAAQQQLHTMRQHIQVHARWKSPPDWIYKYFSVVGRDIFSYVVPRMETEQSYRERLLVLREVGFLLEQYRKGSRVYLFGSGVSGLAEITSDVDLAGLPDASSKVPVCDPLGDADGEGEVLGPFWDHLAVDHDRAHAWPRPVPGRPYAQYEEPGLKSVMRTRVPIVQLVPAALPAGAPTYQEAKARTLLWDAPEDEQEEALEKIRAARNLEDLRVCDHPFDPGERALLGRYPDELAALRAKVADESSGEPAARWAFASEPSAVPLVYLRQWDLSLRLFGVRNSHLLRQYFQNAEPCYRLAGVAAKAWSRDAAINDPRKGLLSSYAVTLMFVYYLLRSGKVQWIDPESIRLEDCDAEPPYFGEPPAADEQTLAAAAAAAAGTPAPVGPDGRIRTTSEQAGEAFVGFIYFYAHLFQWESEIVTLSRGGKEQLSGVFQTLAQKIGWVHQNQILLDRGHSVRYFLRLEDPYEIADELPSGERGFGRLNVTRKVTAHSQATIHLAFMEAWKNILSHYRPPQNPGDAHAYYHFFGGPGPPAAPARKGSVGRGGAGAPGE